MHIGGVNAARCSKLNFTPNNNNKNACCGTTRDHTHLKLQLSECPARSGNNPTFSTVFTHVSHLISMKIHLSTKELFAPYWTMSLSWSPCRRFFFFFSLRPQSHPTDSPAHVTRHVQLIWTHQGTYCSAFLSPRIKRSGAASQKAAMCFET